MEFVGGNEGMMRDDKGRGQAGTQVKWEWRRLAGGCWVNGGLEDEQAEVMTMEVAGQQNWHRRSH